MGVITRLVGGFFSLIIAVVLFLAAAWGIIKFIIKVLM